MTRFASAVNTATVIGGVAIGVADIAWQESQRNALEKKRYERRRGIVGAITDAARQSADKAVHELHELLRDAISPTVEDINRARAETTAQEHHRSAGVEQLETIISRCTRALEQAAPAA